MPEKVGGDNSNNGEKKFFAIRFRPFWEITPEAGIFAGLSSYDNFQKVVIANHNNVAID